MSYAVMADDSFTPWTRAAAWFEVTLRILTQRSATAGASWMSTLHRNSTGVTASDMTASVTTITTGCLESTPMPAASVCLWLALAHRTTQKCSALCRAAFRGTTAASTLRSNFAATRSSTNELFLQRR